MEMGEIRESLIGVKGQAAFCRNHIRDLAYIDYK